MKVAALLLVVAALVAWLAARDTVRFGSHVAPPAAISLHRTDHLTSSQSQRHGRIDVRRRVERTGLATYGRGAGR